MRSGYTCCLENMHWGWTKFATHLWYGTKDGGIAALHYAPSEVSFKAGKTNTAVTIKESTNYPSKRRSTLRLSAAIPVSFPFQLRIPSWCKARSYFYKWKK